MDLEECVITLFKEESESEFPEITGDTSNFSSSSSVQHRNWSSTDSPNNNINNGNNNRSSSEASEPSDSSDDSDDTSVFMFPESVQAIAETVGVELDEEAAEIIGQEAINKLRHLTLLALQFSRHFKSKALRVVDVSKAEKMLDSSSSLGHGMNVNPPNFINLGGLCSEDEGPEIDLLATINDPSTNTLTMDPNSDPIVQSHFCSYHDQLTQNHEEVESHQEDNIDETGENNVRVENGGDLFQQQLKHEKRQLPMEWADYLKHFLVAFFDKKQYFDSPEIVSITNQEYLQEKEILPKEIDGFQIVLKDIAQNGVLPILDIICDFFHDFLNGNFDHQSNNNKQLKRIPAFIETMLGCPIRSKSYHLKLMVQVLIRMIMLPVPCNVQAYVTRTLLKITDASETPLNLDLVRWMTQFIVDVLGNSCNLTVSQLTLSTKSKIYAAIQLAIGFDSRRFNLVKMHLWVKQVIMISNNHHVVHQVNPLEDNSTERVPYDHADSYLEEAILNFISMYVQRYHSDLPDDTFKPLLESALDKYGEKLMMMITKSDLCPASRTDLRKKCSKPKWKAQSGVDDNNYLLNCDNTSLTIV